MHNINRLQLLIQYFNRLFVLFDSFDILCRNHVQSSQVGIVMQISELHFSGDLVTADCLHVFQIRNGIIMAKQLQCCNLTIRYTDPGQVFYRNIRIFQNIMQQRDHTFVLRLHGFRNV